MGDILKTEFTAALNLIREAKTRVYHYANQQLVTLYWEFGRFVSQRVTRANWGKGVVEELDRDVRKPHEKPSIGVLLCKDKDDEVVEYALARSASPSVVAQYETKLIPKELLRTKLHEFALLAQKEQEDA